MKKFYIPFLAAFISVGAYATDLTLSPGQLEGQLRDFEGESLVLSGTINASDLAALEKLPETVKVLDLGKVKIESLTMPNRKYFGRTLFNANEIPAYTFFQSKVESLVLPADVTVIGDGAFAGSDIREIIIPENVSVIGDFAFYGCTSLESVTLPSSLREIGKSTFGNCTSLVSINLSGTSVAEIPEKSFAGCTQLAEVKFDSSRIRKIGREAFAHTAISSLDLSAVSEFEPYALSGLIHLKSLAINPDAEIGDGLLMDNISLANLSGVPDFVPDYFAANCSELDSKTVNQATSLGKYSFANTMAPEELILPAFLQSIDRGALSGLANINRIDVTALEGNIPEVNEFTFEGLSQPDIVLWVDDDYLDLWDAHPQWRLFKVTSNRRTDAGGIEAQTEGISITGNAGTITVAATAIISDVRVFTADGRIIFVGSPQSERMDIDASAFPSGVLIVAASDVEGNSKSVSLLMK